MTSAAISEAELATMRSAAQQDVRDLRAQIQQLDQPSIDLILERARSHYAWQDSANQQRADWLGYMI